MRDILKASLNPCAFVRLKEKKEKERKKEWHVLCRSKDKNSGSGV